MVCVKSKPVRKWPRFSFASSIKGKAGGTITKTTVYLDSEVALSLRRMAKLQGRSQAELIRDALVNYTRKAKRPKLPGIGEFDSGHTDTSERAHEILKRAAKQRKWR
jgi:hypothetical protein